MGKKIRAHLEIPPASAALDFLLQQRPRATTPTRRSRYPASTSRKPSISCCFRKEHRGARKPQALDSCCFRKEQRDACKRRRYARKPLDVLLPQKTAITRSPASAKSSDRSISCFRKEQWFPPSTKSSDIARSSGISKVLMGKLFLSSAPLHVKLKVGRTWGSSETFRPDPWNLFLT